MKDNHYQALRNKLLASMIVLPAIPFILVVGLGFFNYRSSLQTEIISKMTRIVEDHEDMIESFLIERKADLQFIGDAYPISSMTDPNSLEEIFTHLQNISVAFTDIGVFNEDGLHVAYHGPFHLAGKMYKDAEWFKQAINKSYYISDVFLGYRQIPHFIIAVIKYEDGHKWIIRATIDSSVFSKVVEKIRIGKTGEAYLLNEEAMFQSLRRSGGELMEKDDEAISVPENFEGVMTFTKKNSSGESYLYAAGWLKLKKWLLVARQERSEAFAALTRLSYMVVVVTLLGGAIIVLVGAHMTERIISHMETADMEKKELGQQLVVAGRLAEIGEMSAGFAHEINNPLQIIKSELTLTDTIIDDLLDNGQLEKSDDLDQILDSLNQIKIQVDRCGGITQGLLKFARKKESVPGRIDLHQFLPGVLGLVAQKARVEGIELRQEIPNDIPEVFADPVQLEQVFVNFLNNAIHATLEKNGASGGQVTVAASPGPDGQVCISVVDNGVGIGPENIEKIFTPFFTTKPVGKGTGLGLSICYGIISEMGGKMEVKSELGQGAAFSVYLKQA